MNRLKELILVLSAFAAIASCILGAILGVPPAIIALRQLQEELSPNPSKGTPTRIAVVQSPSVPTPNSTALPSLGVPTPTQWLIIVEPPISTPRPTTVIRPTNTRSPTARPTEVACVQGNLAGRVESDIPGTKLCMGGSASSVVDKDTKPTDVYAIDLVAGQATAFKVASPQQCPNVMLYLFPPSTKSIRPINSGSYSFGESCRDGWAKTSTPAVSGTYYFLVQTFYHSGLTYTFSVSIAK